MPGGPHRTSQQPPPIPSKSIERYSRGTVNSQSTPRYSYILPPSILVRDSLDIRGKTNDPLYAVASSKPSPEIYDDENPRSNVDDQPAAPRNAAHRMSRYSARSYISNLSYLNKSNLARFGRSKTTFLISNSVLMFISLAIALFGLFTFINHYPMALLVRLVCADLLFLITLTTALFASIGFVGFLGAFLHRKKLLTIYSILLWPVLGAALVAGYIAYKDVNGNEWSEQLSERWAVYGDRRADIQNKYACCGFYSALDRPILVDHCVLSSAPLASTANAPNPHRRNHLFKRQETPANAAPLLKQFARDPADIQGCYEPWNEFSRWILRMIYICAFSSIPFVLFVFIIGLLAANHIYD
ncbi:hypothetical protein SpCBS45565_g01248 [Spizellomyces sp. 'palustris']|nr:hypothetical protein SpCBS45565_g01248 [Spizellomyces sp. 'palustris']